jgi:hypothetical protein
MKLTLLELTQNILSALNSDEVNSIGDTVESKQVAECIRTSYFNMQGRYDLPEHNQLFQLIPSDNVSLPTVMTKPIGINRIDWVKYYNELSPYAVDTANEFIHDLDVDLEGSPPTVPPPPAYGDVHILDHRHFIDMVNEFNPLEGDVLTYSLVVQNEASSTPNTFTLQCKTDKVPEYCCVLQNYYIIFDSYDSSVDNTLQGNKTMVSGWVLPQFTMEDTAFVDLDDAQYPLLLNEAKSLAFLELKQMPHAKAEQEVNRQLSSLQKFKALAHQPTPFERLPYYGRI